MIIDRENFNPAAAYNLAGKVFWRNFAYKYKVAMDIKEDMVQEAVTRLFELSGKKSTTKKYIRILVAVNFHPPLVRSLVH